MTKRERIELLLTYYPDVLQGLRDRRPRCGGRCGAAICERLGCVDEGVLALMSEDWNHASYQELERLRPIMRERWPRLYVPLVGRFLRFEERSVAWCKRCGAHPSEHINRVHAHPPGRSVRLIGRVIRVTSFEGNGELEDAIEWLERHWQGDAEVPANVARIDAAIRYRELVA